jgi:hypothetical protein
MGHCLRRRSVGEGKERILRGESRNYICMCIKIA